MFFSNYPLPKRAIFAPIHLFLLLCLFSCTDTPPSVASPNERLEKIGTAYCECTSALVALNEKIAALSADTSAAQDVRPYFAQMQTEYEHARECSAAIIAQFGKLKTEEFPNVELILTKKCPALAEQPDLLREMLGE